MLRKSYIVIILVYLSSACCKSKSNRLFLSAESKQQKNYALLSVSQADNIIRHFALAKQFDSVNVFARSFIIYKLTKGEITEAVQMGTLAFGVLKPKSLQQKKMAGLLYENRMMIEKDTAALRVFYNFFIDQYEFVYTSDSYDQQFIEIAEYFVNLQKRIPWLPSNNLVYFQRDLGVGYNVAGDLKKAIVYYKELLTIDIKDGNPYFIAGSLINLCIALNESKHYDSVISFTGRLMHTYPFPKSQLFKLHTIRAEAFLGKKELIIAVNEIKQADAILPTLTIGKSRIKKLTTSADSIKFAAEIVTVREDSIKRAFEILTLRPQIEYALGNFRKSLDQSKQSLKAGLIFTGNYHDREIGKTLLQAGATCIKLQQPDSAIWYFHQAAYTVVNIDSINTNSLPPVSAIYAENTLMDALDSLAAMWDEKYTNSNDIQFLKQALQARKLAFIAEKKLLEAYSYDDAMQAQLLQSKRRSAKALYNCYALWQADQNINWIQEALLVNENSKAIVLLNSVKRNNYLQQLPEKDSAVASLNNIRYQVIMLERKLNEVNDDGSRDSINRELDSINRKFLVLESEINQQYPALKRSGVDTTMISLLSLHEKLLNDNDCLLQYFVADSGAYVLWLDKNRQGGIGFLQDEMLQLADSFSTVCRQQHGLFEKDNAAFFKLAMACTGGIIPSFVLQNIADGNWGKLVVIPDGLFSRLPFEALAINANVFLVNKVAINTGYSLSTLLANDPVSGGNKNISVFTPFSRQGFHQKARLPFTKDEADAIRNAYPSVMIMDDTAATLQHFKNALDNSGIIHIAAHASTSPDDEPRIFFSDSILYMPQLYALQTNADLIVLSSCETGTGILDLNEGPLSLSRAFYYAGAKNVVNSLWQIDDAATAGLFGDFYKEYRYGNTGYALRKAKLDYIKNNLGKDVSPYYWAGLIHIGLDKTSGNKNRYMAMAIILLSVLFLLAMLLLYWRNRRLRIANL